jgi:hypothetical protein
VTLAGVNLEYFLARNAVRTKRTQAGKALANSTNYPNYEPQWIKLNSWHIGAQYFMGLCKNNATSPDGFECDNETWISRAATGDLVSVEPGEVIETYFELVHVRDRLEWHLRIGVLDDPRRSSLIVADRPFMGLVASTTNWEEEIYKYVYVGSCLENYGMIHRENYPSTWEVLVDIWSVDPFSFRDWQLEHARSCSWQPKSSVLSIATPTWQRVKWNATLEDTVAQHSKGREHLITVVVASRRNASSVV